MSSAPDATGAAPESNDTDDAIAEALVAASAMADEAGIAEAEMEEIISETSEPEIVADSPGDAASHELLEDEPGVLVENRLRDAQLLEPQDVELLVLLEQAAEDLGRREADVGRVDPDHAERPLGVHDRHRPGDEASQSCPAKTAFSMPSASRSPTRSPVRCSTS